MVRNSTGKFRSTYSSEGSESPNAGSGGSNAKLTRSASSQESISDRKHSEAALEKFKQSPNSNSPPNFHTNQTDEGERGESWTLFGKNSNKLEGEGQGKLQQRHAHAATGQNFLLPQKQSQFSQHQNVGGNSSGSSQSNNDLSGKELMPISPKGNKNIQQQSVPQPKEAIINRRGHSVDDLTLHAIRKDSKDSNTDTVGAFNFISENQLVAQTQRKDLMLSKSMYIGQDGSASTTAVEEFPAPDSESGDLNELIRNGSGAKGVDTSFDSLNTTSFDSTKILTHLKLE